ASCEVPIRLKIFKPGTGSLLANPRAGIGVGPLGPPGPPLNMFLMRLIKPSLLEPVVGSLVIFGIKGDPPREPLGPPRLVSRAQLNVFFPALHSPLAPLPIPFAIVAGPLKRP